MSANRKAVSTFLDNETAAIFGALCASKGLSRYKALEQAVKEWIEKHGNEKSRDGHSTTGPTEDSNKEMER